ncbi:MAG: fumarylacetoacetate hydrolase family protein [Phototrophicales bacterium]|nr:fumarylacetoacetate hydrolase family protein [Phototrophicales bacterium]
MKLVRFSDEYRTNLVGILEDDTVYATTWTGDMLGLLRSGIKPTMSYAYRYPIEKVKIQSPYIPPKIVCVGRNYADHAEEMGNVVPEKPFLFGKFGSSIIATHETIQWSTAITTKVDWEGELAVIIGKSGRNIAPENAYNHIFGYSIANDVSARDLQENDGQWARAKGMDTFCPFGPAIVTRNEIPDPHDLILTTTLNGEQVQNTNTSLMIHKIPDLIAYISTAFALEVGDLILTGTPAGVGKGMKPPRYLSTGDVVSVSISGIGTLQNPCQSND